MKRTSATTLIALSSVTALAALSSGLPPAPTRQATADKEDDPARRSSDQRRVTGPETTMRDAIARGATASVILQPVSPQTVPPSSYPAGSSIVGQKLTLGSVPARIWLEVRVTGWAPQVLRTVQVRVDPTGFLGSNASCAGMPANGGDLLPASQSCGTNSVCRNQMSGITSPCFAGEPSYCIAGFCEYQFQNQCDAEWILGGLPMLCDPFCPGIIDYRFGTTVDPFEALTDFSPSYIGTLVLDTPPTAKGLYTIGFDLSQTFLQDNTIPMAQEIPIASFLPGQIDTTCGACCTNLGPGTTTCTSLVSAAECQSLPSWNVRVFVPGSACEPSGVPCCSCLFNADCNDNDACTTDICQNACVCVNAPKPGWNPETQCCNPANGAVANIPPSTPCLIGGCSLNNNRGVPITTPLPQGLSCDWGDPCLAEGTCNASGVCVAAQDAGSTCPKPRFVSFAPTTGTTSSAYRVKLVSLHHPNPPYTVGSVTDFSAYEGEYRWVGEPRSYPESSADPTPLFASRLQCAAYYRDWSPVDLLYVSGAEVVPSSSYELWSIPEGLDPGNPDNYSYVGLLDTARWGDSSTPFNPPSSSVQPDFGDVSGLVSKFKSAQGAPVKARALLVGSDPGGLGLISMPEDFGFTHIAACVDAFKGLGYPHLGPQPCP